MKERETMGNIPESGGDQEEEILDIADLLENLPEIDAAAEGAEPGAGGDGDDFDLEAIFSDLDEALPDEDEEVIDLVDLAGGEAPKGGPDADAGDALEDFSLDDLAPDEAAVTDEEGELDLGEDFISASELEDLLGDSRSPSENAGLASEQAEFPFSDETGIRDADLFAAESAPGPEATAQAVTVGGIPLTEEQIDGAVERVIRKLYAEKIDAILVEAVERTVNREISRLKAIINRGEPDH